MELAAHFKEKAAQLRHEGLGRIKITLTGTDTSSLLEILERYFGHVGVDTTESIASAKESDMKSTTEEKTSDVLEKIPTTLPNVGGLATVELVFPLKFIPTVIAGLPESYLPLHGPETLSQYLCQFPFCTLDFFQKAAACNHICHDHLKLLWPVYIAVLRIIPKYDGIVLPLGNTIPSNT